MVAEETYRGALLALNSILVLARSLASDEQFADLASILDVAEYLPLLLLDAEDRTAAFREQLEGLSQKFPAFGHALERFDSSVQGA